MKIKQTLIITLLFIVQQSISQNYQTIQEVNNYCTQLGATNNEKAEVIVENILDNIGFIRNFKLQKCPNINKAIAKNIDMGYGRKERYILYDETLFSQIDNNTGKDWSATSVLVHEMGHHLKDHALNDEGSNPKWELEADEFSGLVLARMGASLNDAQSAIQTLSYENTTQLYPAKENRLIAIKKGWKRGKGKLIVVEEKEEKKVNKIEEKIEDDEIIRIHEKKEEDEIVKIHEKKEVEFRHDETSIQQIFSRYIDVIGGQENIMKIKTMSRELKTNSSIVMNGEETNSVSNMTMDYLTPNNYISKMPSSNFEMLKLDKNFYTKDHTSGKWKFNNYNERAENQVSYIWEYSCLINNSELVYLGIQNINGVSCHAIQMPSYDSVTDDETFHMTISIVNTVYYSLETGLLSFMKMNNHSIIDYKINNEYLKDSDTHNESLMIFTDYRPVNGVLFSFKTETISSSDTYSSRSKLEYTDIKVNSYVNKDDFIVRE